MKSVCVCETGCFTPCSYTCNDGFVLVGEACEPVSAAEDIEIVDHGDGYHSLVAHLATMRTATGEAVDPGDVIGTVGDTGSLKGPYLYFEIREKGRPIDPREWLGR